MQNGSLGVHGYKTDEGFHVPEYGTFLKPPKNGLRDERAELGTTPDVQFQEKNPRLERCTHLSGQTRTVLHKLVDDQILGEKILNALYAATDMFEFVGVARHEGKNSVVRRANFCQMFDVYILRALANNAEGDIEAYGFLASYWIPEHDVAVLDSVWSLDHEGLTKEVLYQAIEHEIRKTHKVMRICTQVDLSKEGPFFARYGYRFMKRNEAGYIPNPGIPIGRTEMVKILHPNFDPALIDQ